MTRAILASAIFSSVFLLSLATPASGDLVLYYQGTTYEPPTDGNFTPSDFICGIFAFPMQLPTIDGAFVTPTSATLQTSENGSAGFFSSTRDSHVNLAGELQPFTWDATLSIPLSWNYAVESGDDSLTITSDAFGGDTMFVRDLVNLSLIAGTWSTTIPTACNTAAHSAISAVPEPSAFLLLALVGNIIAARLYFRGKR